MRYILFLFSTFFTFFSHSQTTGSFQFEGNLRQYIVYVPSLYNPNIDTVPLVLSLHGLGDNMNNFSMAGFHSVADTANFIVVTPEALPFTADLGFAQFPLGPAWNSGAGVSALGFTIFPNEDIDDVGFINALIDSLSSQYNIDSNRLYATGFSMGGFMSHRLACELDRMAAIAPVAGTIGSNVSCVPTHPISVCHIHGTGDATVTYNDNQFGMDAQEVVDHWVHHNNASAVPDIDTIDMAADGNTVYHYTYSDGDSGTVVEHFRIDSLDHNWLIGSGFDISYPHEIWRFFRDKEHKRTGQVSPPPVGIDEVKIDDLRVGPNPANDFVTIYTTKEMISSVDYIAMYNSIGNQIWYSSTESIATDIQISVETLPAGMFVLEVAFKDGRFIHKKVLVHSGN